MTQKRVEERLEAVDREIEIIKHDLLRLPSIEHSISQLTMTVSRLATKMDEHFDHTQKVKADTLKITEWIAAECGKDKGKYVAPRGVDGTTSVVGVTSGQNKHRDARGTR